MRSDKLSIIINNFNYGRYLNEAIQSVLNQSTLPGELIVVDDGSTDDSREILSQYEDQIKVIYKSNGGQASAFNEGYRHSSGNWIWFVDADDFLTPDAVSLVSELINQKASKIHSPLLIIHGKDQPTDELYPSAILSTGNVISDVIANGDYIWPPTTGNVFHKTMMQACMPIPESDYRLSADFYLCSYAAFHGEILQTRAPVGYYRIHGNNRFYGSDLDSKKLKSNGEMYLLATRRIESLVKEFTSVTNYTYPYNRRMLEFLTISHRFGGLNLPKELSGVQINKKWLHSKDVKSARIPGKIKAVSYWIVLNFFPRFITSSIIKYMFNKTTADHK